MSNRKLISMAIVAGISLSAPVGWAAEKPKAPKYVEIDYSELLKQIKYDIGTFTAWSAPKPPANNVCDGNVRLEIESVKVTTEVIVTGKDEATAGVKIPLFVDIGADATSTIERNDTVGTTIFFRPELKPKRDVLFKATAFNGTPISDALKNITKSIGLAATSEPCVTFDVKDTANVVKWGFTVSQDKKEGGGFDIKLITAKGDYTRGKSAENTIEVTFKVVRADGQPGNAKGSEP